MMVISFRQGTFGVTNEMHYCEFAAHPWAQRLSGSVHRCQSFVHHIIDRQVLELP